jgi:hypothetical protein
MHVSMTGNIPIFTSRVVVFGEIGIPPLTKRLNNFASIRFHKDSIPLFLGIMGALDGFQAQSSHYPTMTNFKTSV